MAITSRILKGLCPALLLCVAYVATPLAENSPLAMKGYDPVNYFTEGRPAKGNASFSHAWDDEKYLFVRAEHRDRFAKDPARYAPQFPGFCAAALSRGEHVVPDPENWIIIGSKLYLFGKPIGPKLFKERPELAEKSAENWVKMRGAKQ